ncbi:hypothetical protein KKA95_01600 [Patescibacteria group bacterium]|nr:hypothetical protein [Patescibacteria group bacterium]
MENEIKKFNIAHYLYNLSNIAAFVMMLVIIAFGISGYGLSQGIISKELARTLHFTWLAPIGVTALTIHTYWNIHLSLKRYHPWNIITKIGLFMFYAAIVGGFVYLEYFHSK